MIIGIESVYGDKRLIGKELSSDELKSIVDDILAQNSEEKFVSAFCMKLGYKELPYSDGYAAYIIDLDTRFVYSPSYTFPHELDGAEVLFYTDKGVFPPVFYSGGTIAQKVSYLAVCKYENDDAYYIFHCNESLEVVADDCFSSIDACKKYMSEYNIVWHEDKQNRNQIAMTNEQNECKVSKKLNVFYFAGQNTKIFRIY